MLLIFGYNSLENPIGIETDDKTFTLTGVQFRYNSLENPIGIETSSARCCTASGLRLQLIRKPDRD